MAGRETAGTFKLMKQPAPPNSKHRPISAVHPALDQSALVAHELSANQRRRPAFCTYQRLPDWNIVVDLGLVLLRDALCDPDDVAALLLLQLQVGVEGSVVELLQERVDVEANLREQGRSENRTSNHKMTAQGVFVIGFNSP